MTDKNDNKGKKDEQNKYLSLGIGMGLAFGASFGVLFDQIAIGSGLGLLLGIVVGAIMDKNTVNVKKTVIKIAFIAIVGILFILLVPSLISLF